MQLTAVGRSSCNSHTGRGTLFLLQNLVILVAWVLDVRRHADIPWLLHVYRCLQSMIATFSSNRHFGPNHVVILIPVWNDWQSAYLLLQQLREVLAAQDSQFDVLLVDDGSREPLPDVLIDCGWYKVGSVRVLRLRRNLGHQTAIAIGLSYIEQQFDCEAVLIMDGDGEDSPAEALRLVDAMRTQAEPRIIFAERTHRSEGLLFRFGYMTYRIAHRLLTGRRIRFGNFSIIPRSFLSNLVVLPELWVHYAAAVLKSRLPFESIQTRRSRRLAGVSKMNLTALTLHGIRAFSVCSDIVGARVLLFSLICLAECVALIGLVGGLRLFTDYALPGWASTICGLLVLLTLQLVGLAAQFALFVAGSASSTQVLPCRDSVIFMQSILHCNGNGFGATIIAPSRVTAEGPSA
ncbi:MAG: glycosyltransferase [Planctomycetes bacterium]|nr:glycosyltransferase [Planctomycetota bacterium]